LKSEKHVKYVVFSNTGSNTQMHKIETL